MMRILHQDSANRIELHQENTTRRVAVTFTWYGYLDFDTPGFAVHWLLAQGVDVIAVKCIDSSWFQRLEPAVLASVQKITATYDDVVLYGSSMGGFAAIAFAKALGACRVVALSPQFDITQGFDTRWAAEAARIDWRHRIAPETAAPVPTHILYDDQMPEERAQIDRIRAVLPPQTTFVLAFPHAGHPVTSYLLQTGELGPLTECLLSADGPVDWPPLWSAQRKSAQFLRQLATRAFVAGRLALAELCYRRALLLDPERAALSHQMAALLLRMDRADEAIPYARRAVELAPGQVPQLALLARLLLKSRQFTAAQTALDQGLALSPEDPGLLRLGAALENRRVRQAGKSRPNRDPLTG